jgi:hypothetical protein
MSKRRGSCTISLGSRSELFARVTLVFALFRNWNTSNNAGRC